MRGGGGGGAVPYDNGTNEGRRPATNPPPTTSHRHTITNRVRDTKPTGFRKNIPAARPDR